MSGSPRCRPASHCVALVGWRSVRLRRRTLVLLTVALAWLMPAPRAASQDATPAVQPPAAAALPPRLVLNHITVDHGLSDNQMRVSLQDRAGFLWFGTYNGLNRYDGYEVVVFRHDPADPASLSDNAVHALYEDTAGTLWVGTGLGLNAYDRATGRFTRYQHDPDDPDSLSNNTVLAIHEDRAGTLWVGTQGGGLNRFDRVRGTFTAYRHDATDPRSLGSDEVYDIHEDAAGTLWVAANGGGLNRFDPTGGVFTAYRHDPDDPRSLSNDSVLDITGDRSGALWIGTFGGGLNRFDPATGLFTTYRHDPDDPRSLNDDRVFSVIEDETGALWVGTFIGGLNILDIARGQFAAYMHDTTDSDSLSNNRVADIYRDRSGLIWLATEGGGVDVYNPQQRAFTVYRHDPNNANSLASNTITAVYEDDEGVLWLGTQEHGLDRLDRRTGQITHYPAEPENPERLGFPSVFAIHGDRSGALWIATYGGGLYRMDPASGVFTAYRHDEANPQSLSSDNVVAIAEDRSGTLWIGTVDGGLNRFDPASGIFTAYRHDPNDPQSLSGNTVSKIQIDRQGQIWLATAGVGLDRLDPASGRVTRFHHDPKDAASLSHDFTWSVYEDRSDAIWVSTWGGALDRYDPAGGGFIHHNPAGLTEDKLRAILEQGTATDTAPGDLWITRSRTLVRLDRDGDTIQVYDRGNGLPRAEFNNAATKSVGGELLLGTFNTGLVVFDPARVQPDHDPPPVALTDFQLANRQVPIGGASPLQQAIDQTAALTLSYADHIISLEFAGLSYRAPLKARYRYMLEGFDTDWTEVDSTRRLVTYTNLDPGQYTFRVIAANGEGVWNAAGRALAITIVPPWWQTWWFRTLLIGSLVGLAVAGYWRRMAQLRAQQKRLEQQVTERTGELATLLATSQSIVAMLDLEPLLDRVLEQLARLIDYDAAFVGTLEGDTLTIRAFRSVVPRRDQRATRLDLTRVPPLRALIASRQPFVIDDLQQDAPLLASIESTLQDRALNRAMMGVPLVVQDRVIGVLSLLHQQPGYYVEHDLQRVQSFANQVALALENARLYERAREAATLEERARLARELHDAVTQTLFSASLVADALPDAWHGAPPIAVRGVEYVRMLTHGALAEMRALLVELRPSALTEKPLSELVQALCTATASRAQVPVDFEARGACTLAPEVQITLYRIAQEALNNVVKHADARAVRVRLACEAEAVELEVADDGRGFDVETAAPDSFGQAIMRERAAEIGAALQVRSAVGTGTTVTVVWRPPGGGASEPAAGAAHAAA